MAELSLQLPEEELWVRVLYPNPARVSEEFIEALALYPWTGHAELMGTRPARILSPADVLGLFAEGAEDPRDGLIRFMRKGLDAREDDRPPSPRDR